MQVRYQAALHAEKKIIALTEFELIEQTTYLKQFLTQQLQSVAVVVRQVAGPRVICLGFIQRQVIFQFFNAMQHDLTCAFFVTFELNQFLQLVARTTDGEALFVQQISDASDHQHFMVLVITAIATALDWAKLRKFLLPIAQHVRLDTAKLAHLTNGEVALGWNRREGVLH